MGRELGINRIDFLKDGTAIIRSSDYNLCGRTDFTGAIADLFYLSDKSVYYLIVCGDDMPDILNNVYTVHVKVEDKYWSEKEFDLEYAFVNRTRIKEICDENASKDNREIEREKSMLEDARIARQHTTTLKNFENFTEFIDNLLEHFNDYCEEAKDYWNEFRKIERTICDGNNAWGRAKDAPKDAQSWILLTYSE